MMSIELEDIDIEFLNNNGEITDFSLTIPSANEFRAGLMSKNDYDYLYTLNSEKTISVEFVDSEERIPLGSEDIPYIPKGMKIEIVSDTITELLGTTVGGKLFVLRDGVITEDIITVLQNYDAVGEVIIKYKGALKETIEDLQKGVITLPELPNKIIENLDTFYPQRDDNNQLINIGNFRSYSAQGTSHLDIKVNVLSWASTIQEEVFMQTVCGPITINNSDKKLVWINGKRFSNYYRTSSRDENNNLIWSEWKIVNDFEINKKTEELSSFLSKLKIAFENEDLDTIVSKLASLK